MSAASATSPTSPLQHRDIRSASKPFKRDKDHGEKWSMGQRPSGGVSINYAQMAADSTDEAYLVGGSDRQREKVRPQKQWSQITTDYKSHANQTPKPTVHSHYSVSGGATGRVFRKVSAALDAAEHTSSPLSKSLMDLLPTHVNNTDPAIQIQAGDEGVLYSFDNKGTSPGQKGREVELGGLVELAEKRFLAEQTERIVKGEYEVIDGRGEITVLGGKKGKKGSPKQRAVKSEGSIVASKLEDDDGFELV